MNYIIYVDVYFFVNFFMNSLLLSLLYCSSKKGKKALAGKIIGKIALGAFTGGILSSVVMILVPEISFIARLLPVNGITGYLMIWIAFDYKGIEQRMQALGRLWLLEMILSGILTMILKENSFLAKEVKEEISGENLNFLTVAGTAFFAVLVLKEILNYYLREKYIQSHLYAVEMRHKGRCYAGTGLLDTGNSLREPISGKAVVIAQFQTMERLLGKEDILTVRHFGKTGEETSEQNSSCLVRWIPYHSLGKKNGFMPGVIIDEMAVYQEGKEQICKNVLIGIVEEELSEKELYQFILHEEYIEEGKVCY